MVRKTEGGEEKNVGKDDRKGWRREKRKGYKIGFWNVASLENKDREFWEGLKEWDVIFLIETWI